MIVATLNPFSKPEKGFFCENATSAPTAGNCSANMDAVALMTDANNSGQLHDIAQFRAVAILSVEVSNSLLGSPPGNRFS